VCCAPWHQVLSAGENEDIGFLLIAISGQTLSVLRVIEGSESCQPSPNGPFPEPES
jgi:hypothetical protein